MPLLLHSRRHHSGLAIRRLRRPPLPPGGLDGILEGWQAALHKEVSCSVRVAECGVRLAAATGVPESAQRVGLGEGLMHPRHCLCGGPRFAASEKRTRTEGEWEEARQHWPRASQVLLELMQRPTLTKLRNVLDKDEFLLLPLAQKRLHDAGERIENRRKVADEKAVTSARILKAHRLMDLLQSCDGHRDSGDTPQIEEDDVILNLARDAHKSQHVLHGEDDDAQNSICAAFVLPGLGHTPKPHNNRWSQCMVSSGNIDNAV
mmetsp:Transcript_60018/g.130169  ORF Transcript_60018/g.130169 Transcript_60018/m.130169 type:complete len:262 (-) Transcript_60018:427-1212(-)